jgi:hypothetical protein
MSERTIGRAELVRQLGVSPRLVRELLRQYHGWLSQPDAGRFTALDLARLQIAARGRVAGRAAKEIESQLLATRRRGEAVPLAADGPPATEAQAAGEAAAAQEAVEPGSAPAPEGPIAAELQRLHQTLSESAERERKDRDRMLTALMRTQQEVAHLREELGTYRSRRQRKRGLMRWFRG